MARKPSQNRTQQRGRGQKPGGADGQQRPSQKGGGGSRNRQRQGNRGNFDASRANTDETLLLEGKHAFEEAIATEARIECVYATDSILADPYMSSLVAKAKSAGAKVQAVDGEDLAAISSHGAHQGIAARLKPYKYAALSDLINASAGKENALIIACDHVTDAGNFGAICRTAEIVGASGMLIPNKRSAQVNTAAYKTSAGAVMHLPIAREANLVRSLQALKDEGFWVAGASEHAQDVIWDAPLSGRIVLVMGSEGAGLSRLTLETCDLLVKLPQAGKIESLNVAQATTAIAYEWMRQCSVSKS